MDDVRTDRHMHRDGQIQPAGRHQQAVPLIGSAECQELFRQQASHASLGLCQDPVDGLVHQLAGLPNHTERPIPQTSADIF
jgi:hypothetical protein